MAAQILGVHPGAQDKPLILADKEHFTQELFGAVRQQNAFDLLCAVPTYPNMVARWRAVPPASFTEHWPGYATTAQPYHFQDLPEQTFHEYVQRNGLRTQDLSFAGFLGTALLDQVPLLTRQFPDRWHVEEFFKFEQALGWDRAGTLNLNIRYGHLSLVLVAQAALHQLRQRLGAPFAQWDALHFARHLFEGVEGDVRVQDQTIVVTLYNVPDAALLEKHLGHFPEQLAREGVDPHIPWLYNFNLDFRFR